MDVFDLDRALIQDYERFARSFATIRAPDINEQIDALYAGRRFWPEAMIGINPRYERGPSIPDLVADGTLHEECAKIFRLRRGDAVLPLTLHRHQPRRSPRPAPARASW